MSSVDEDESGNFTAMAVAYEAIGERMAAFKVSAEAATPALRTMHRNLLITAERMTPERADAHLEAIDRRRHLGRTAERNAREKHEKAVRARRLAPWESQWPRWREDRINEERERLGLGRL